MTWHIVTNPPRRIQRAVPCSILRARTHTEPKLPPSRPRGYRYVVGRKNFENNWQKYAVGRPSRLVQPHVCQSIPEAPEEAELEVVESLQMEEEVEVEPRGIKRRVCGDFDGDGYCCMRKRPRIEVEVEPRGIKSPEQQEEFPLVEEDVVVIEEDDTVPETVTVEEECGPATYENQLGSVFVEGKRRSSRHLQRLGSISDVLGRRRSARLSAL